MAQRGTVSGATTHAQASEQASSPVELGKGRPTPSRKEREEQRHQPLVPKDRKLAKQNDRARQLSEREKARAGMAAGDERYLPVRDKGVQRRYARDYIDARWSIGELFIPFVILMLLASFIPITNLQTWATGCVFAFFVVVIADGVILRFRLRSKLSAKFGSADRGVTWYAFMRSIYLRRLRMPKPQVSRGEFPS